MISTSNYILTKKYGYIQNVPPGSQMVWNGQKWKKAVFGEPVETEVVIVYLENKTKIITIPEQMFLTTGGWKVARNLSNKNLALTLTPDNFELKIPSDLRIDRYRLGILYSRLFRCEPTPTGLRMAFPEKEFDLTNEFIDILKKLGKYEIYTEFSRRTNKKVFEFPNYDWNINHIYSSKELARGFITGLLDSVTAAMGTLKIKGRYEHLQHIQRILMLFRIRSVLLSSLYIYKKDISRINKVFKVRCTRTQKLIDKYKLNGNGLVGDTLKVTAVRKGGREMCQPVKGTIITEGIILNG
jgi:hypothetical protein